MRGDVTAIAGGIDVLTEPSGQKYVRCRECGNGWCKQPPETYIHMMTCPYFGRKKRGASMSNTVVSGGGDGPMGRTDPPPEGNWYGPMTPDQYIQLENTYTYHPPFGNQTGRYMSLRASAKALAEDFMTHCPPSRERSLALTNLEQAIMWANAAIARNETPPEADAQVQAPSG